MKWRNFGWEGGRVSLWCPTLDLPLPCHWAGLLQTSVRGVPQRPRAYRPLVFVAIPLTLVWSNPSPPTRWRFLNQIISIIAVTAWLGRRWSPQVTCGQTENLSFLLGYVHATYQASASSSRLTLWKECIDFNWNVQTEWHWCWRWEWHPDPFQASSLASMLTLTLLLTFGMKRPLCSFHSHLAWVQSHLAHLAWKNSQNISRKTFRKPIR